MRSTLGRYSHLLHLTLVLGSACSAAPETATVTGDPLPGLSAGDRARFEAGLALFNKVFLPEEGLGPFFNENQCSACHTSPATGGTGEQSVVRASHFDSPDRCNLLSADGGDNVQRNSTPALRALGINGRTEPVDATERGLLRVPFLFGLGLVEAVPEASILTHADPDDRDGDGISGRPGRTADGSLARFGRKAEHVSIADFSAGALFLEMGITNPAHPIERGLNGSAFDDSVDPAPDPELDADGLAALVDFIRFLAPPARRPAQPDEVTLVRDGEELFGTIGCSSCHVPEMVTGRSSTAALDRKPVRLYSDLLLHDMGPGLAGFCATGASPTEWRTEPLMGLRQRDRYLHDGRAYDLFDAIRMHGGEATAAQAAFAGLDRLQQEALLRFLGTL